MASKPLTALNCIVKPLNPTQKKTDDETACTDNVLLNLQLLLPIVYVRGCIMQSVQKLGLENSVLPLTDLVSFDGIFLSWENIR